MATQLYSFKITYTECDSRIWRIAAVSSNYSLAQLGYLVLATFDTLAYHLFEMKYKDTRYFLTEEDFEDPVFDGMEKSELLSFVKIGKLGMHTGDVIEMTYDQGCCQVFKITLLEIRDMPKGCGRAYPKILDAAGRGIVDDMPPEELAEAIRKIDLDNALLKGTIERIRDEYENCEGGIRCFENAELDDEPVLRKTITE